MTQPDRNKEHMYQMWGTDRLVTDYGSLESPPQTVQGSHFSHGHGFFEGRVLREVNHDDNIPKKHDFTKQNELHQVIRNDEDYDDWEYGTEPQPSTKWI